MEQEPGDVRTPVGDRANRVHRFAGRVREVLEEQTVGGARVAELTAGEAREAVVELSEAINRLEGLRAAVLAHR
jgi:hypothetical protein